MGLAAACCDLGYVQRIMNSIGASLQIFRAGPVPKNNQIVLATGSPLSVKASLPFKSYLFPRFLSTSKFWKVYERSRTIHFRQGQVPRGSR